MRGQDDVVERPQRIVRTEKPLTTVFDYLSDFTTTTDWDPGTVSTVTVDKKSFKAAPARVTLKDTHIKVDGCVGQSFLRSYATLTSSTTDTDDVVAYYGVTKSV